CRRASTEMSENDAPVAPPRRQEAGTRASIARDKAAEIAVSGSGILVAVEICPGAEGIGPKHEARPISRRWSASGLVGITKRHRLAIRAERHGLRIERGGPPCAERSDLAGPRHIARLREPPAV